MDGDYRIILKGLYHTFTQDFERVLTFDLLIQYQKDKGDGLNCYDYTFRHLSKIDACNLLRHITMTFDSVDFMEIEIQ